MLLTLGATLVSGLVLIALAELLARFWLKSFSHPYIWKPGLDIEMHPRADVFPRLSKVTRLKANRLGIRGDDVKPGAATFRIVAAGGSAVECFALDQDEAWPEKIGTLLKSPSFLAAAGKQEVQVLNTGKSGFTNETLCYLLPRLLPRIGPVDVLLVMTGMGAVNSWVRQGTPSVLPTNELAWDDLHWHAEASYGWTPQRSALLELARRFWYASKARKITLKASGGSLQAGRDARARATDMRDVTGDPTQWIANFETALEAIVTGAQPWARRIILIRQPWFDKPDPDAEETAQLWQGYVGSMAPEARTVFYTHRVVSDLMTKVDSATERVGARLGITVLRPADVIVPSVETFYDHCHLTPEGARQLAAYVAEHLATSMSSKPLEMSKPAKTAEASKTAADAAA